VKTLPAAKPIVLLCVLAGFTFPFLSVAVHAQQRPTAAQTRSAMLRNLNNKLLEVYDRRLNGPTSDEEALHSQARAIVAERAATLESLIQEYPAQALALALPQDALTQITATFPEAAGSLESQGAWSGELEYLVQDNARLHTSRDVLQLKTDDGVLDVHFAGAAPDGLESGVRLQVHGVRVGTQVAAYGSDTALASQASETKARPMSTNSPGACTTTGPQNSVVLLATFPGVPTPTVTPASIHDIFFATSGRSLNEYWSEASNGATTATGDVFGWYTLDTNYTCSQAGSIRDAAMQAAAADVGDFTKYSRLFVIFPDGGACSWSGMATIGCSSVTSPSGATFIASSAWLISDSVSYPDDGVRQAAHEGGHNLGLNHANSRAFSGEPLGAPGVTGTITEYGDGISAMSYSFGHYAASHKSTLGWINDGAGVQTVTNNGSFTLQPFETPGAVQALKIQRGTGSNNWLWLEYRTPTGAFDSLLPSNVFAAPGALIHYQDSITGIYSHLLDFTPATSSWWDAALPSGSTWVDPYTNLSISVGTATSTGIDVTVAYGPMPCVAANPTVAVSPSNASANAGGNVNYTVSVTSNDSSTCASRVFNMSSLLPSWATTVFSQSSVTLTPGGSTSVTMTKSVPANATPGTYAVDANVGSGSTSGSASGNLTVMSPVLSIALSVPATSYTLSSTISFSAAVRLGSNPASGASVTFVLTNPLGSATSKKVTTGSNGVAVWSYKPSPKDPKGTYKLTATSTYNSQTAAATSATFTINK
jgi:M6 family metalloprotease-like protein